MGLGRGRPSAKGFELVVQTAFWNVWSTPAFRAQYPGQFDTARLTWLDACYRQIAEDIGIQFALRQGQSYDATHLDIVLDPASQGGAHTGTAFGAHGVSLSPDALYNVGFGTSGFWWFLLMMHETVNVITGSIAQGWVWADGSSMWAGQSPFPNMCLPPEEEVVTSRGLVQIADVKEGDCVLTHKGRFQKVLRTFARPYSGRLLSVNGVKMTPEHPVLTRSIGGVHGRGACLTEVWAWMEAKDLIVQGYDKKQPSLFLPRITETKDVEQYDDLPVNQHLMTIVGYYLAEGCTSLDKKRTDTIFVFGYEPREMQHVFELVEALKTLGLRPRVYFKANCTRVEVASRRLGRFLEAQFGKGARNKCVPSWVKCLPADKLQALFECYVNGDGHLQSDSRIVFHCSSRGLTYDIRDVALKLGYTSTIPDKAGQSTAFSDLPQFYGAVSMHESRGIRGDRDGIYPRIKSVCETEYEGLVYNLAVEADNSFCTREFAVHNCDIVVPGELGRDDLARAQLARMSSDPGVGLFLSIQRSHGWMPFRRLFRWTREKNIVDWHRYREPSLRTALLVWFLECAIGPDATGLALLDRFNAALGQISGQEITDRDYSEAQALFPDLSQ